MASVAGSTRSSIVRARRGAPDGRGGRPPGLEQLVSRRSLIRPVAPVDANGISQVPWRSVPCLCPAPGPRSSRRDLACGGLVDAAPGFHKPKASAGRKISRLTQGFSIRCLRFTSDVAATHAKTRFRLAGCASTGRASNPLDRCERFQVTFPSSLPGLALSQAESSPNRTLSENQRCYQRVAQTFDSAIVCPRTAKKANFVA
jgi:hypothetical protein